MTWTQFMDMHSGGGQKLDWAHIFIEATEKEARVIFYNRFGRNPDRITCTCCGNDYSVNEEKGDLSQATGYERNCDDVFFNKEGKEIPKEEAKWVSGKGYINGVYEGYVERTRKSNLDIRKSCNTKKNDKWGLHQTMKEFEARKDILIIRKEEIKPKERNGSVPDEGFMWIGD